MSKNENLRDEWAARITKFRSSGLTMSTWCTANQVTLHQLKYWLYKAKSSPSTALSPTNRFVPLEVVKQVPTSASSLVVRVGGASVELRSGFDTKLFREVVQALQASC